MSKPEPVLMRGLVVTKASHHGSKGAFSYEMEFALDGPFSDFDASKLPPEIECVEILEIIWRCEP